MSDLFNDVAEFHTKFRIPVNTVSGFLPTELMRLKLVHLLEELEEIQEAHHENNLEEIFDGLIDLVYVALGTAHLMKLPFNEGWKRVHEANMNKARATHASMSKRNSTFDVVKPEGWQPPVLSDLLED